MDSSALLIAISSRLVFLLWRLLPWSGLKVETLKRETRNLVRIISSTDIALKFLMSQYHSSLCLNGKSSLFDQVVPYLLLFLFHFVELLRFHPQVGVALKYADMFVQFFIACNTILALK